MGQKLQNFFEIYFIPQEDSLLHTLRLPQMHSSLPGRQIPFPQEPLHWNSHVTADTNILPRGYCLPLMLYLMHSLSQSGHQQDRHKIRQA